MEPKTWKDEILAGLDHVPAKGPIDTVVVMGHNAEPILTGRNAHQVFIAAGVYGKGRVVVFSGRDYAKEMEKESSNEQLAKLRSNLLKWLCPGQENPLVINITEKTDIPISQEKSQITAGQGQNKVLLWQVEHPRKSAKFIQDFKDFMRNGGGAIITKTPSGYEWRHGSLDTSPVFDILHDVGIYFFLPRAHVRGHKKVTDNEAHLSHLGRAIDECLKNPRNLTIYGAVLGFSVHALPNKGEIKAKLRGLLDQVDSLGIRYIPRGSRKRIKTPEGINLAHFVHSFLWEPESGKAPGTEDFPGDFDTVAEQVCREIELVSKKFREAHSIGVYLPPGGTVKVEVVKGDVNGWKVRVGAHADDLSLKDDIKRWLRLMALEKLKSPVTEVFNPFGGLVYLDSPYRPSKIHVRISNVVESPVYDIKQDDCDGSWKDARQRPGLWTDLIGHHIRFTLPSSAIRDIENIRPAVEFWDRLVSNYHDLRGTKPESKAREWVVADMQPSVGAMHSGYPIVTHLNIAEEDNSAYCLKISHGSHWGLFHELGHNMQKGAWTASIHIEVTCNIFSMYGNYIMYGIEPWEVGWVDRAKGKMKAFLLEETDDRTAMSELGFYAQLARDFGFEAYKKVFRSYVKDKDNPKNDQDKFEMWGLKFSTVVGYNIVPAYELWRRPISETVKQQLQGLTPYLPDDDVTQVIPEKVNAIIAKYPGIVRRPSQKSSDFEESCPADDESEEADPYSTCDVGDEEEDQCAAE